ncbi:30S ribosome-binding factor RbfA [Paenibacillus senegalensis]|uniref:30S ribosome-binding factor RbfA n=1 Tax=Paenibacillus senegalensis TaxID=1465766 RepID=UPI0002889D4D|nr:30S ribosome-binding factor RbfA [Paenibacillus senegalensis]
MAKIRTGRVAEQIKKELSQILQSEFKDPRVGFITLTGVDVTNDLSQAKVFLSVMGTEEQKEESLRTLTRASGFLRSELAKKIRLRVMPELLFKVDSSIDYGSHIEKLLHEIQEEEPDK